jgi:hypothetical protein
MGDELKEAYPYLSDEIGNYEDKAFTNEGLLSTEVFVEGDGQLVYSRLTDLFGTDRDASAFLHSIGIRGIKYADGFTRNLPTDEQTFNYVMFDPADAQITGIQRYMPRKASRLESAEAIAAPENFIGKKDILLSARNVRGDNIDLPISDVLIRDDIQFVILGDTKFKKSVIKETYKESLAETMANTLVDPKYAPEGNLNTLNKAEGQALRLYFQALAKNLDTFKNPVYGFKSLERAIIDAGYQVIDKEGGKDFSIEHVDTGMPVEINVYGLANETDKTGNGERILMDTSSLKSGTDAGKLYANIYDWAYNSGNFYKPDSSLTDVNRIRQWGYMLSSALKYGSTKHMQLSEAMSDDTYSFNNIEENPFEFQYNLSMLLMGEYESIRKEITSIAQYGEVSLLNAGKYFYDFSDGMFKHQRINGDQDILSESDLVDWVNLYREEKFKESPSPAIGLNTLKRFIIENTIIQKLGNLDAEFNPEKILESGRTSKIFHMPSYEKYGLQQGVLKSSGWMLPNGDFLPADFSSHEMALGRFLDELPDDDPMKQELLSSDEKTMTLKGLDKGLIRVKRDGKKMYFMGDIPRTQYENIELAGINWEMSMIHDEYGMGKIMPSRLNNGLKTIYQPPSQFDDATRTRFMPRRRKGRNRQVSLRSTDSIIAEVDKLAATSNKSRNDLINEVLQDFIGKFDTIEINDITLNPDEQRVLKGKNIKPEDEVTYRNVVDRKRQQLEQAWSEDSDPDLNWLRNHPKMMPNFKRPARGRSQFTQPRVRGGDNAGAYKGAPKWVNKPKSRAGKDGAYTRLVDRLYKLVEEGISGRYWYEESGDEILRMLNNDVVEAEKFIELIAIYSPQTKVDVNTYFAVRAYEQFNNGVPREEFNVNAARDAKAISVLYDNESWAGRKTDNFYKNLMYSMLRDLPQSEIKKLKLDPDLYNEITKPVTIDMWVYRAFGYDSDALTDQKGQGAFGFAERELNRIAEELNAQLAEGEDIYMPHQIQAMLWTAIKARSENKSVKQKTEKQSFDKGWMIYDEDGKRKFTSKENERKHLVNWTNNSLALDDAIVDTREASGSFKRFLNTMNSRVLFEVVPSPDLPVGRKLMGMDFEDKIKFSEQLHKIILDENGNDVLAAKLGIPIRVATKQTGGYEGGVEPNVVTELYPNKPKGTWDDDAIRAYARAVQYIYRQKAVPWMRFLKDSEIPTKPYYIEAPSGSRRRYETLQEAKLEYDRQVYAATEALEKSIARLESNKNPDMQSAKESAVQKKKTALDLVKQKKVMGDDNNYGVMISYDTELTTDMLQDISKQLLTIDPWMGYTQISPTEIIVVNFKGEDGLPSLTDQEFAVKIHEDYGKQNIAEIQTTGEYFPEHDWKKDPNGRRNLLSENSRISPDIFEWIRSRRELSDQLQESFKTKKR